MDEIDRLLSELKVENEKPQPTKSSSQPPAAKSGDAIDRLLEQVKSDYDRQDCEQEEIRQAQLKAEQLKQQQLQQEKRKELQKTAQAWLDKLDPFSPEGLWFERFAEKYESKLAAAIDYLLESSS
ncbi:salt stress protein, Slr1339 family [Chroococcidiopsis sp.]|uniref:salt stress protein, Slr1339 family n=1 Tax=Chroococcidiopsis sp. TaxID=3088168 RepID=UPI003F3189CD